MLNKLKHFLLFCGIICGLNTFAQGETCATATAVTAGTFTAPPLTGTGALTPCPYPQEGEAGTSAAWYSYTPAGNFSVTVSSCEGGADTRLGITEGACGAQTCVGINDDFVGCAVGPLPTDPDYASSITFVALSGVTYYIQWDDQWSTAGFDWSLVADPIDCPVLVLNFGDPCDDLNADTYNDIVSPLCVCEGTDYDCLPVQSNIGDVCDFVGTDDGAINETCDCVALTVPDCAINLSPFDGELDVPIVPSLALTWELTGFQPEDSVRLFFGTDPLAPFPQNALPPGTTGINFGGVPAGVWYWYVAPSNSVGLAVGCETISFTTIGGGATDVPNCPTALLTPTDLATGVVLTGVDSDEITLSWTNDNSGELISANGVYFGTDPLNLDYLGDALGTAETVTFGGVYPEVWYWSIVPSNSLGEAVGCPVFSFTTVGGDVADVPDCPTLLTPADAATGVVLNGDTATLTWANALTGEFANFNGLYFGLDPLALNFLGNADAGAVSQDITGVQQGLTYYWSIVPSNPAGESVGCSMFSFTVAGTPDCPLLGVNGLNFGMGCDDLDANTIFDVVLADCTCAGTPIPANATCAGAEVITDGINTAKQIIGGGGALLGCFPASDAVDALWYSYTPICDGNITVRSSIDLDQPDTRLSVYSGTCGALVCEASNDDVDGTNFTSALTFVGTGGTTYLIEWDNRWGNMEFDFEVFSGSNCPTDFDLSGTTDGDDFSSFLGNFGLSCLGVGDLCACETDLNHNGTTDGEDFSIFLGNYGLACPAP